MFFINKLKTKKSGAIRKKRRVWGTGSSPGERLIERDAATMRREFTRKLPILPDFGPAGSCRAVNGCANFISNRQVRHGVAVKETSAARRHPFR
jgi:hypothetical protein